jgi:signal transduction histidine kinase/ligand-binding sensor domain-containing protein
VGTDGGLDLLDQKTGTFKHFSHKGNDSTSLSFNTVRSIYEDRAGELWVGTGAYFDHQEKGGLNRFHRETGSFTRYRSDPANAHTLIDNRVRSIYEDSRGTFWIGTNGNGLHTMDRKTGLFTRHQYNPQRPEQLSRPPVMGSKFDHITFITEDADKKIWIGSYNNGLTRYDPASGKITRYGNKDDKAKVFNNRTSWCAYATRDGLIWIGTEDITGSLHKIDIYNTIIPHYGNTNADGVFSFYEESATVCWYGTKSGLIRKDLKDGTTRRFINKPGDPNSISSNAVTDILKDKQGDLWISTYNGLNHFNQKTEKFTRYFNVPDKNTVYALWTLCEETDSTLWVGRANNGGLDYFNKKTGKFKNYKIDVDTNTIINSHVTSMYRDENFDLWIGTASGGGGGGGFNKMDIRTGKITRYLPEDNILTISRDAAGMLWIGTTRGLFRYDKQTGILNALANENSENYLSMTTGIVADKEDNLWVSTITGIYMVTKNRDQVIHYGKEYAVSEDNFFWGSSSIVRQDGEISFGNTNGYYSFHPEKLKAGFSYNQLYFTGFWLGNKQIRPSTEGPLKEPMYTTKEIRLNHDQNVFAISAAFIDFRTAPGKKINYTLENYDDDWRTADVDDKMQYHKVPPGEYIFRIKIANSRNGEWIEKTMAIIVSPPWWATWWAYLIYGLLLVALAISIYRFQKARLIKAEQEKARAKELAQAKEIEKAYTELKATQAQLIQSEKMASLGELTAGIAHEIQNPLNFVNNFSEINKELLEEANEELVKGDIEETKSILKDITENEEKISHHGKRADAIVKGMLQHSRSTSGVKEPTDINALADEYLRLAYHGLKAKDKSFSATVKTNFDPNIGNINIIPQDIGRALLNLINNAFYAVNEKKKQIGDGYEPEVTITTKLITAPENPSIRESANSLIISVRDNGDGISDNIVNKIFQPFFTTKPTGEGTGLGLSLSYDIVKAHGGELKVETKGGQWSEFTIQLPT